VAQRTRSTAYGIAWRAFLLSHGATWQFIPRHEKLPAENVKGVYFGSFCRRTKSVTGRLTAASNAPPSSWATIACGSVSTDMVMPSRYGLPGCQ
jgi:hypothetical protein